MGKGLSVSFWVGITRILKFFAKNETLLQFLRLNLDQQRLLLESLAKDNMRVSQSQASNSKIHTNWRYRWQGIRKLFQLPCDYSTRKARGAWIDAVASKESKILVLGDDDYLSVELSDLGFKNVEVADFDREILSSIEKKTRENREKPRCFQGDFRDKHFLNDRGPDIICIDPPYNLAWTKIFIDQAIRTSGERNGVSLMLMLNQRCFEPRAMEDIMRHLQNAGFSHAKTIEGFNTYPLQGVSAGFLKLAIQVLTGHKIRQSVVFTSDLIVFDRLSLIKSENFPKALQSAALSIHEKPASDQGGRRGHIHQGLIAR